MISRSAVIYLSWSGVGAPAWHSGRHHFIVMIPAYAGADAGPMRSPAEATARAGRAFV